MTSPLPTHSIIPFQNYIYRFYDAYGRHDLPWRQNYDPYRILVSEIMLQQTQVDRVIPKYLDFMSQFPNLETLAQASPGEVIKAWQGLGYNRRGLNLQRAAQHLIQHHQGVFPTTATELLALPGVGPYTSSAIQAFAFNQPAIVIETNIRTVFIYHFFPGAYNVTDQELLSLIEVTLDKRHPRQWYSALMDYGAYLKTIVTNPTRQSKLYVKQSKLQGSNRQARGLVLKNLTRHQSLNLIQLITLTNVDKKRLTTAVDQLEKEGFITQSGQCFRLKD